MKEWGDGALIWGGKGGKNLCYHNSVKGWPWSHARSLIGGGGVMIVVAMTEIRSIFTTTPATVYMFINTYIKL